MGTCLVCPDRPHIDDDSVDHIRLVHPEHYDDETWPDGRPIIVDPTLEPDDFAEERP